VNLATAPIASHNFVAVLWDATKIMPIIIKHYDQLRVIEKLEFYFNLDI